MQTAVKDDPEFAPFFKMLKNGVPLQAVKNKMFAAGLDSSVLDSPDAPAGPPTGPPTGPAVSKMVVPAAVAAPARMNLMDSIRSGGGGLKTAAPIEKEASEDHRGGLMDAIRNSKTKALNKVADVPKAAAAPPATGMAAALALALSKRQAVMKSDSGDEGEEDDEDWGEEAEADD